jgi:hypothetical protein
MVLSVGCVVPLGIIHNARQLGHGQTVRYSTRSGTAKPSPEGGAYGRDSPRAGPEYTFLHVNLFHNLELLPFEQVVAETERLLGRCSYLPNQQFRRL